MRNKIPNHMLSWSSSIGVLLLALGLVGCSQPPTASTAAAESPAAPPQPEFGRAGPDVERLATKLGLNASQTAELETILEEQGDPSSRLSDATRARIREILTPAQATRWDALQEARDKQGSQRFPGL